MWRCIPPPTCECCCGQTPHCSPLTRRFFHRPPPARSASKESLLSSGWSATSPAPPVDDVGDQDRSLPWSGFDDELPPNQEAIPATPPAPTPQSAPGPSSLPLPTQPLSDPTLALLMNMMTTFQSEMKSLRSDLSGSVSSMVAEAVAAQLPQVLILIVSQALLFFVSHHCCCSSLTSYDHVTFVALYCCAMFFLGSLFHQALPNLAPPALPPAPALPVAREPTGVLQPGSSGCLRSQVLVSRSVIPHCVHIPCCYMLVYLA